MRIHKDKHIGRVLFVVEGSKTEFNMMRRIFCNIFNYKYIEKRRNRLDTFISQSDRNSTVAVVNTRESNIKDITDHRDYLDAVFNLLREEYQFPVDKSAVYYVFDRDPESNTDKSRIQEYIGCLNNPYDNEDGSATGQLLLSYPSIESYIISNFCDGSYKIRLKLGADTKEYIGKRKDIQLNKINEETLLHAAMEFADFLTTEGMEWEIDDFKETSLEILDRQDRRYMEGDGFHLFSMLTLAFLQLGLIEL